MTPEIASETSILFFRRKDSAHLQMGVSKNRGKPPKSSILIGFSIIFTIHFGGKNPIFLVQHPNGHPGLHGGHPGLHGGHPGLHGGHPGLHGGHPGLHGAKRSFLT